MPRSLLLEGSGRKGNIGNLDLDWPERETAEIDQILWEPTYQVLSASGKVLGKFQRRESALAALDHWPQATAVICGVDVVADKSGRQFDEGGAL